MCNLSANASSTVPQTLADLLAFNKPKRMTPWPLSDDLHSHVHCGYNTLCIAIRLVSEQFTDADDLDCYLAHVFSKAVKAGLVIGNGQIYIFDTLLSGAKGTPDDGCPMYAILKKDTQRARKKDRRLGNNHLPFYLEGVVATSSYNLGFELNALGALPAPSGPTSAICISRLLREVVTFNHRHVLANLSSRMPALLRGTRSYRAVNERVYAVIDVALQEALAGRNLLLNRAWAQKNQQFLLELHFESNVSFAVLDPVPKGRFVIRTFLTLEQIMQQLAGFTNLNHELSSAHALSAV